MSNWAALSVSLILVLHIIQGKVILEFEEIHILVSMLIGDLFLKIVTVVSVSCWGCAMRIYVFPCGLDNYRYKKFIKYDI